MSDGTTNFELNELAAKLLIKNFKGCFMRDELIGNGNPNECMIINLDTSSNNGTHWAFLWIENNKPIYYSSFGDPMPMEVINYCHPHQILTSDIRIQDFNEKNCGLYCILILYLLSNGHKFENIILNINGTDDTEEFKTESNVGKIHDNRRS